MKTFALFCSLGTLLLGSSFVLAQTPPDEHAGHHPEGAPSPATSSLPPGKARTPADTGPMRGNMKTMQGLMAKIHASKDDKERQRLLQQHSQAMNDQMEMMRGMAGNQGGMAGGSMKTEDSKKGGANQRPNTQDSAPMGDGMMNQMMMHHQAMQDRMEMMEMMMGQMLEHQNAQRNSKPAR